MGEEEILHVLADKNTIYRFEMDNSFHFLEGVLFCLVLLKIFSHLYFADQTCHCRLQKNKNGDISHKDTVKAFQGKNTRWVLKHIETKRCSSKYLCSDGGNLLLEDRLAFVFGILAILLFQFLILRDPSMVPTNVDQFK